MRIHKARQGGVEIRTACCTAALLRMEIRSDKQAGKLAGKLQQRDETPARLRYLTQAKPSCDNTIHDAVPGDGWSGARQASKQASQCEIEIRGVGEMVMMMETPHSTLTARTRPLVPACLTWNSPGSLASTRKQAKQTKQAKQAKRASPYSARPNGGRRDALFDAASTNRHCGSSLPFPLASPQPPVHARPAWASSNNLIHQA